jgi:capsid protein
MLFGLFKSTNKSQVSASEPVKPRKNRRISAKYDAAQEGREDRRHWEFTDNLSPVQANSRTVRERIRRKSRYELDNNGPGKGIVKTYVNDLIGTLPSLSVSIKNRDTDAEIIQHKFTKWAKKRHLGKKMRIARQAQLRDGESFAVFHGNRGSNFPIQLDLVCLETEMCQDPTYGTMKDSEYQNVDGIFYDSNRNPVKYRFLKEHPGGASYLALQDSYQDYDAKWVHHFFDEERPGQARGIPELSATLLQFANLRRYSKAVLGAAEISAELTGVIETTSNAEDEEGADPLNVGEEIAVNRNTLTSLPYGWKMNAFKPEQPTTTYSDFKKEIVTDVARPLCMPRNKSTGSSADHNYSSGKLDFQAYNRQHKIEQNDLEETFLQKAFELWFEEASNIRGYLPDVDIDDIVIEWTWDSDEDIDPSKDASANETKLNSNQTNLKEIYARKNKDWKVALLQRAAEIKFAKEHGITTSAKTEPSNKEGEEQNNDEQNADD